MPYRLSDHFPLRGARWAAVSFVLATSAAASAATQEPPAAQRPQSALPGFALPSAPTRPLPPDLTRRQPDDRPHMHGRVAPGYELQAVLRETSSLRSACELGLQIDNIGDRTYQSFTINLLIAMEGRSHFRTSEIPVMDPMPPKHAITARLAVGEPCAHVEEVRIEPFSRCIIDNKPVGDCRPPMLTRSISRIRFGL